MQMAEKSLLPVITLIGTPREAYPGIGAESRNISEAIATNLFEMSRLKTPILVVVMEKAVRWRLGIGVGDKVLMLQYSYYATITPEGCAFYSFKMRIKNGSPLRIMGIPGPLVGLALIDGIIPDP